MGRGGRFEVRRTRGGSRLGLLWLDGALEVGSKNFRIDLCRGGLRFGFGRLNFIRLIIYYMLIYLLISIECKGLNLHGIE